MVFERAWKRHRVVAACAAALICLAPGGGRVDGASASLVKSVRVVIETRPYVSTRAFTLSTVGPGPHTEATGSAARTVRRRAGTPALEGMEVLHAGRGTLVVGWTGVRGRESVEGVWSIVAATGSYAGVHGRGRFSSDRLLRSIEYRGVLVAAV